jgi:hypothetical protein
MLIRFTIERVGRHLIIWCVTQDGTEAESKSCEVARFPASHATYANTCLRALRDRHNAQRPS